MCAHKWWHQIDSVFKCSWYQWIHFRRVEITFPVCHTVSSSSSPSLFYLLIFFFYISFLFFSIKSQHFLYINPCVVYVFDLFIIIAQMLRSIKGCVLFDIILSNFSNCLVFIYILFFWVYQFNFFKSFLICFLI